MSQGLVPLYSLESCQQPLYDNAHRTDVLICGGAFGSDEAQVFEDTRVLLLSSFLLCQTTIKPKATWTAQGVMAASPKIGANEIMYYPSPEGAHIL